MELELNNLKYFYIVSQKRSFTLAAKALHISQPGVSRAIRQLEQTLAVDLIVRRKKGILLTQEGEILYKRCESIFQEVAAFKSELHSVSLICKGPLNIGASDNLCNYVLPFVLKDFCRVHPEIIPRIFSGTAEAIQSEILADQIELGLFYTPVKDSQLIEEKICFVENVVIYPVEKTEANISPRSAIEKLQYIGSRRTDYQNPYPALKLLRSLGIEPEIGYETNNQEAQKRMVLAGLGYSVMPRFMVDSDIKNDRIRCLKTTKKLGNDLRMAKKKRAQISRQAEIFLEYFKANIQRYL